MTGWFTKLSTCLFLLFVASTAFANSNSDGPGGGGTDTEDNRVLVTNRTGGPILVRLNSVDTPLPADTTSFADLTDPNGEGFIIIENGGTTTFDDISVGTHELQAIPFTGDVGAEIVQFTGALEDAFEKADVKTSVTKTIYLDPATNALTTTEPAPAASKPKTAKKKKPRKR